MNDTYTHTYTTIEGDEFEITLRNTMLGEVRFRTLSGRFATEDYPDASLRENFAWIMAFAVEIKGLPVKALTEKSTLADFEKAYYAFMGLIDSDTYWQMVRDANAMLQATTSALEKPDDALTDEEHADPN